MARGHPPPTPADPEPGVAGDRTRGPQPGVARERPPKTHSRKRGTTPRKPADLSQEWRRPTPHQHQRTPARSGGEPPRTLSQEWRGAIHHQHQRAPSQEWRGTAPGALSQEWRGNAHREPTAGSEGPRPANRRTSARSGEGPPPTNTKRPSARRGRGAPAATGGEPQPGEAGTRTQATRPGKAKSPPPHHRHPIRERRETHHHKPRSERGGGTKGAYRGTQARDSNLRGLRAPPLTVSAPPEHTQ